MKTRKSNVIMFGILLSLSLVLVLTGCKKKVQSANATSSETYSEEQESMQLDQLKESFSYLQSEDAEDEEPVEEPNEEPNEPDKGELGDDELEYPDEKPYDPLEEPNDFPEEDPSKSWAEGL